jgi:hypothetical protein
MESTEVFRCESVKNVTTFWKFYVIQQTTQTIAVVTVVVW